MAYRFLSVNVPIILLFKHFAWCDKFRLDVKWK